MRINLHFWPFTLLDVSKISPASTYTLLKTDRNKKILENFRTFATKYFYKKMSGSVGYLSIVTN